MTPTQKVILWLYSLVAAGIGGVGTAVSASIAGQAFGAIDFTPRQLSAIAVGGAITAVAAYLKDKPLPRIIEEAE